MKWTIVIDHYTRMVLTAVINETILLRKKQLLVPGIFLRKMRRWRRWRR